MHIVFTSQASQQHSLEETREDQFNKTTKVQKRTRAGPMALLHTSSIILPHPFVFFVVLVFFLVAVIPATRPVLATSSPSAFSTTSHIHRSHFHPKPNGLLAPPSQSADSALPLPFNNPTPYGRSNVQLNQKFGATVPDALRIQLHPRQLLHSSSNNYNNKQSTSNNRRVYLHHHNRQSLISDSGQDVTMDSVREQQQQKQERPQEWNHPSGTAFAEGLPLWTSGTTSGRPLRNPFVKSFGLRHKATMDWGMRARARTQKHWDKYWHQLENRQESNFGNIYSTDTDDIGSGTDANAGVTSTDKKCTDNTDAGTECNINCKGLPGESSASSSQEAMSDLHTAQPFPSSSSSCASALNCSHNSNLDNNTFSADVLFSQTSSETATATAIKDGGIARTETEPPGFLLPPPGDNDGPGSLFFFQLLNHYQNDSSLPPAATAISQDTSSSSRNSSSPPDNDFSDNHNINGTTHSNSTFRQYYQINREFYKPGGPIILWLPGESPLHSLFLRRGLAYELANATAGLLVALEHRFYGNSIPRFQDSPASLKKPIVFDTSHENQGSSSSSAPSSLSDVMLSEPEYSVRHMMVPPAATEEEELQRGAGGREEDRSVCMTDPLLSSSSTSSNSGSTKFHYQIGVDKTSHTRIKGHKHKIAKGGKHQPHDSNNQTDKNNGNHTNNDHNNNSDSTTGGEKEGLPLDLLKYLNVDQSIEDIARFMDLFPSLQPKLFPVSESNGGTLATNAPTKPRWILAGCSYGGNLAAWTRQRYPSKVFAAFASSAPVRSALDFFEYSTSQIDILGDKCSSQLGFARDFLDGALEMTDEFMQQMVVEELEVKQGNTKGLDNSGDLTSAATIVQEQGQLDEDASSNVYYPSSLPLPLAAMRNPAIAVDNSNDDKARRQAAKLRVLSWFSPDFAREYAAEGEEIHAAGWVWWTVASAVQYNAVVTPITVQPAKTAVDILCDAMDLAKVDDILENGTSSPSINNSSDQSQLKSLRYTKALAAWFKDQQYFTPTKQEDLQPSDLDPTSVQNLAGMAWLWQTCSELGYLQTAHPSTCCCPSLARVPSPVQSFNYQRFNRTCYEQGSKLFNNTCPFTSEEDKALQKETIYPADTITSESSYLEQPPTSKPTTTTTTTTTTTGTITAAAEATGTGAGPTCLPCRCYANEAQRSESVFSRLLTLEAAWQECQFYFSSTHPPAKNPVTKSSPSSLSSPISSVLETREGTFGNISRQQPPASSVNVGITSPSGQEQQSKPNSSDNHQVVTPDTNAGTTTQQQQKHDTTSTTTGKRDEVLLMGYPDVETNVNTKFHGWEIAQDPCYPTASASDRETSFDSGGNGSRTGDGVGDNYPQSGEIHFISPSTTTGSGEPSSWHAGGPESESIIDFSGGREVVEQTENEENDDEDDGEDNAMEAQGGLPHIASELDDWLLDHPGGRYYFTNGEKDPWKELTLASSRALEFLSRPKAGRGSINNSKNFAGTDDKRRGMNRANTKKDYSTVQDREFQESEEALEPARPFDAEEIREHQVTGKELPSVDATFGMRKSHYPTHHHHHHRHHRRHKHHRRRHHPNKHHHHLKHHQLHRTHRHKPKHQSLFHPPCTTSTIDPCTPLPLPTRNSRGVTTTRLPRPKQSDQDEDDVAGDTSGPTVVVVDDGDEDEEKNDGSLDDRGGSINNNGNGGRILKEDEYGDRTVVRIISDASHCQDILYESSDQHSIKLRAEREHVLKTFVRWIEIDNRRQQRVSERRQQRQQQ